MTRIAFVLADGYEDSEFRSPYDAARNAGHEVVVLGTQRGAEVTGKRGEDRQQVDRTAKGAEVGDFDALVIPGGHSPDRLRIDPDVVAFTRKMVASGKPVAAICHGPQLLIEADVVHGKRMTSWPSVRKDLENAGATWVDEAVVQSENVITSRKPEDLDAFDAAWLAEVQAHAEA